MISRSMRLTSCIAGTTLLSTAALSVHAASQPSLKDIFRSELACQLIEPLFADMSVAELYTADQSGNTCALAAPNTSEAGRYYLDASCQTPFNFEPTTLQSYCANLLDPGLLGEGDGIADSDTGSDPGSDTGSNNGSNTDGSTGGGTGGADGTIAPSIWTLPPGTRFDVGARSLGGLPQPYLKRSIYRRVQTERGECTLEMRVYARSPQSASAAASAPQPAGTSGSSAPASTSSPAASSTPALLAFHGGSWSARGFGFFGLELTIPQFVDAGFVVYVPFYRLLGDDEGSAACNNASFEDIVDDASFALDWVQAEAANYGTTDVPVVFGQSAGAHLAASLAVNRPDEVSAAVLFYPPTDFTDFTLRAQQGLYTNEQGLGILERVLGTPAGNARVEMPPIPANSFPERVINEGIDLPPVFMLHGQADDLVEARQSSRLCDAARGVAMLPATDTELPLIDTLRERIACGDTSELQLIREGQHALDVCLTDAVIPTSLCPSGSAASREEVSDAIGDAVTFAIGNARIGMADDSALEGTGENAPDGSGDNPADESDSGSSAGDGAGSDSGRSGGGAVGAGWLILLLFGLRRRRASAVDPV